jgi:hypothetical protein
LFYLSINDEQKVYNTGTRATELMKTRMLQKTFQPWFWVREMWWKPWAEVQRLNPEILSR